MSEPKKDWYDAVDHADKGVTVGAGRPTITIPAPTPDQAAYLAQILEASKYDPNRVIGGPQRGHCTEGRDCNCGGDTPEVATIPGKKGLYHFWTDARDGGTCRRSLGTENLEEASLKLADIVLRGAPAGGASPLSVILDKYFTERTDKLPSGAAARHAGSLLLEHWGERATVNDVTLEEQKKFAQWCVDMFGHSLGYISRNLSVLSAALNHAGLAVTVIMSEAHMRDVWKVQAKPPRKVFVPTDQDMARILRQKMPADLERWLFISMTTACRPEAAIDLRPEQRIREAKALDLNPPGRAQTKKRRPVVKEPRILTAALDRWEREGLETRGGRYCGYASVDSADSALERLSAGA